SSRFSRSSFSNAVSPGSGSALSGRGGERRTGVEKVPPAGRTEAITKVGFGFRPDLGSTWIQVTAVSPAPFTATRIPLGRTPAGSAAAITWGEKASPGALVDTWIA